jgi:hypothetical protein
VRYLLVHEKVINETLEGLLLELKEECENYIKLMNQLELENLTKEQIEEMLGEIMASVVSLEVHSEHAKEELYNLDNR